MHMGGIFIKVKYLESLLTILFVHLFYFFYNDYNNKIYHILSYLMLCTIHMHILIIY